MASVFNYKTLCKYPTIQTEYTQLYLDSLMLYFCDIN